MAARGAIEASVRNSLTLSALALILAFTISQYGGVTPREWNVTLISLVVVSLVLWLPGRKAVFAPGLPGRLPVAIAAVFIWVGFQLLPLPLGWLRILSPARFDIARGLESIHRAQWVPLSVSPQLTLAHILRLLAYLLVFFLLRELSFRLANRVWLLVLPLLVVASAEASIGLVQHFESGGFANGTYANHGHLAGLLEMVLPVTVILIPMALRRKRGVNESTTTAVLVCLAAGCTVLILLGLLYTASRMGLAAAAISISILAVLEMSARRNRNAAALFATIAVLIILMVSAPLSLVSRYEGDLTSNVRLQIWGDTLKLIANYPVFGCGLGTFVSAVQKYRAATPLTLVDYAHSDYLQLLAELGSVGFLLAMAVAILICRDAFASVRTEHDRQARLMQMACVASIAAIAVHSLVDFQFYIPANVMVAAWIAGLASGIGARALAR